MMRSGIIVIFAILSAGALAQNVSSDLEDEKQKAKKLTKAMQNAQLLLSNMSVIFECDYAGYDVHPRDTNYSTTYLVVIDVKDATCNDMVKALNGQGAKDDLVFVSEKQMSEVKPLPESGHGPFDDLSSPPMDYTLIHEVDPETINNEN